MAQKWPEGLNKEDREKDELLSVEGRGLSATAKRASGSQLFNAISRTQTALNGMLNKSASSMRGSMDTSVLGGGNAGSAASIPETPTKANQASNNQNAVFNGLRVRMGIATGKLPQGGTVRGSAVMDLCKGKWGNELRAPAWCIMYLCTCACGLKPYMHMRTLGQRSLPASRPSGLQTMLSSLTFS